MSHTDTEMEAEIQEKELNAPRVTLAYINEMLDVRVFYRFEQPQGTTTTFCHTFLDDAFYLTTGRTACVSLDNFDAALGMKYAQSSARDLARDKLFELEGYRLYAELLDDQYGEMSSA